MIKNDRGDSFLLKTAMRGDEADGLIDTILENCGETHTPSMIMQDLIESSTQYLENEDDSRDRLLSVAKKSMKSGAVALVQSGAEEETALINAVKLNDFDLVSLLLSSNININLQNEFGNTALIEAVFDGVKNLKIIKLLLKHKANMKIKNNKNQTVYEILNLMEIHNYGTNPIMDHELLFRVEKYGNYLEVLNTILKETKEDLDFLDSKGDPLFFMPLIQNHFALYKLYIKFGVDVNLLNKAKHNIFVEYVCQVFKRDKYDKNFRNNLSSLLSSKINKNSQDGSGSTVLHKVISTKCNEDLFKILTSIASFDYKKMDNLGRTSLHSAIWNRKNNIAKILQGLDNDTMNMPDTYGLLPIDYSALLGSQEMLLYLLKHGSNVRSEKQITNSAIKKFRPMLKNLPKLKVDIKDKDIIRNVNIVIRQIMKDFKVI
jgi:ankyrin repeat protein